MSADGLRGIVSVFPLGEIHIPVQTFEQPTCYISSKNTHQLIKFNDT